MKKALVAGLLSIILVLPGTAVQAGGYYRGHGGHFHHNGHGDDVLIADGGFVSINSPPPVFMTLP